MRISGSALAYCTVSMVTADFEAVYSGATTWDSTRSGSSTAANDPSPLVTLTMVGAVDWRSVGGNALVIRTTLTTLVPKTSSASAPVRSAAALCEPMIPALLMSTSSPPSAVTVSTALATDASLVTSS